MGAELGDEGLAFCSLGEPWTAACVSAHKALAYLLPPILILIFSAGILYLIMRCSGDSLAQEQKVKLSKNDAEAQSDSWEAVLSGASFGLVGVLVAFLYVSGGREAIITMALPAIFTMTVTLFQLAGRLSTKWNVPYQGRIAISGGILGAIGFIYSVLYFDDLTINYGSSQSPTIEATSGLPKGQMEAEEQSTFDPVVDDQELEGIAPSQK